MAWRHALVGCMLLLGACGLPEPPNQAAAPTVPAPTATVVPKRPEDAANAFFIAWQQGQFATMYDLLSSDAQAATAKDIFLRRYANIRDGIGETKLTIVANASIVATGTASTAPTATAVNTAASAEVPFTATHTLAIFGDVVDTNSLPLVQQQGLWKVAWQPGLIFSGLTASSTVRVTPDTPTRGKILDRADKPLADNGTILSIGVVPGEIKDEPALLKSLSEALQIPPETVKQRYQGGQPTWFMPIADRPESARAELEPKIDAIPGVVLQNKPARVYPLGPAAAHVVGYVGHPTADELRQQASAGLTESDWIGRSGIEAWAEDQLAGKKGGSIQIVDQGGKLLRTIAQKPAAPGKDVKLTIDAAIQTAAMQALGDKTGSVVIMDPRDRGVLALVSQPSFDPNRFVVGLTDAEWQELNGDARPLLLRATESGYPTGSIFKVITLAAALESGVVKTSETFDCGNDWNGLPGVTLHNWQAQGTLQLTEALTESCNPAFYEMGLRLDRLDPTILPTFARAFGLGRPTTTPGVHESPGTVPDPSWKQQQLGQSWSSGDSVNLAIGQGYLLATPMQMANAYASLSDGRVVAPSLVSGTTGVTSTAKGTAYYAFRDEKLPIAAKTGSAENENPDAHAWFVGFLPPDKPSLLVLVMVEGGQHGGTVAAPIARTLIDMVVRR